ncbi:hypothetical protein B0A50_05649 [Salinomyces thailandicus]|uniref:Uncharacterized protein n=1 Tax=Salinomyces thailandicus TaxID=706561 RepID=A0A4U0TUI3_9PEZI|nr:hypothetical protein B0A50_05649 [Salinomyces thailandica]
MAKKPKGDWKKHSTLTTEEREDRKRLRREGRCFVCRKEGHRRGDEACGLYRSGKEDESRAGSPAPQQTTENVRTFLEPVQWQSNSTHVCEYRMPAASGIMPAASALPRVGTEQAEAQAGGDLAKDHEDKLMNESSVSRAEIMKTSS